LIGEWAEIGRVDLDAWDADHVMSVLSSNPDYREKFVALLQIRLGEPLQ
jgi:hypothetical protein